MEYFPILIFSIIAIGFATFIAVLPFFTAKRNQYKEKNSPYECGFQPINSKTAKINVRFYIISILFLIFDVEVACLIPWAISGGMGLSGLIAVTPFFLFIILSFIYEWSQNAMDL